MSVQQFDIIVVGAGIAGSALACALGDSQWRIALIEGGSLQSEAPAIGSDVTEYDPRVSALTSASHKLLTDLGVWPAMADIRVSPYQHMHVWDAEGTGAIDFDATDVHELCLGHIVENRVTTWALQQKVHGYANVTVMENCRVAGLREVSAEYDLAHCLELEDGRELQAGLVVAADGALSTIRRFAGLNTREWDYEHVATVTTVRTEKPHQGTAWQRFLPEGPLAFLPLDDPHTCSIVWSAEEALAEQLKAMDDDGFRNALGEAIEHQLGEVQSCSRRFSFPLRQRHATSYYKPGLVLVGDAAHTIHPLAGQGINLGLKDVVVLAEEIQRAAERQLDPGSEAVLARFQRRRLADNLGMMALMEGFKRLFAQRNLGVRWLRNAGMSRLNRMPWVKQQLIREAMGI